MEASRTMWRWKWIRAAAIAVVAAFVVAACSASNDSGADTTLGEAVPFVEGGYGEQSSDVEYRDEALSVEGDGDAGYVGGEPALLVIEQGAGSFDAKIIRDGTVDLRIDQGTFGSASSQLRSIAADLGGYVSSGESTVEQYGDERYAVGWFTMQVPVDRFDDAVARVEALGVAVSSSMSSQDVTEEYVDLEGRLSYWRDQEAFYSRLMEEAMTIEDLVAVQTRMQDVLLNIEQIEGRLRYLDGRTTFATLTVGLTEVPETAIVASGPSGGGPIADAFAQAGDVLLATVGFLIVAAAALIPIGLVAVMAYLIVRLFLTLRRKRTPAES